MFTLLCIIKNKAQEKQQIFPLNRYYNYFPDYSYMKDINNELSPYVGIYKARYKGKKIILYITKEEKKLVGSKEKKYYQDVLHVKYIIKKISNGKILQDTQNSSDLKNSIISVGTSVTENNSISFFYSGTHCDAGWGRIALKKINDKQISWSYFPYSSPLKEGECIGKDTQVYLPTKKLIFKKRKSVNN